MALVPGIGVANVGGAGTLVFAVIPAFAIEIGAHACNVVPCTLLALLPVGVKIPAVGAVTHLATGNRFNSSSHFLVPHGCVGKPHPAVGGKLRQDLIGSSNFGQLEF